jgi:hypothetical protein
MTQKFTAIWQPGGPGKQKERDWILEIFRPYLDNHIVDGKHEVVCDNAILFDAFIHSYDPSYYKKFKGLNAFLCIFLDEFYEGRYELYENFKGVWRTHWSSVFNPTYVRALPIGRPEEMDLTLEIPKASERRFVWSAIGGLSKSSRPDVLHAFGKIEPHFVFATDRPGGYISMPPSLRKPLSRPEYQRVMLNSIFSPSPMGNANIECRRTYEAMDCGSIPIVERRIGLDYYKELLGSHPIPTVRSWSEARSLVVDLLDNPQRLDALQAEIHGWWSEKIAQIRAEIGEFIEERSNDPTDATRKLFEPRANSNIWRYFELARHHDLRAGGRRIAMIVSRVLQGSRLRKAHGHYKAPVG